MSGPPKCVCSICGQEVQKSQTKHVGDGKRACVSHDGVDAQAKAARDNLEAERIKHSSYRISLPRRSGWQSEGPMSRRPVSTLAESCEWTTEHCWCCGKKGISDQEFHYRLLLWSEKGRMEGNEAGLVDFMFAPLTGKAVDRDKIRKELRLVDGEVVFLRIPLPTDIKVRGRILDTCCARKRGMDRVVELIGVVQICAECTHKFGLESAWELPDLKIEDLEQGAVMVELMRPVLQEEVRKMGESS